MRIAVDICETQYHEKYNHRAAGHKQVRLAQVFEVVQKPLTQHISQQQHAKPWYQRIHHHDSGFTQRNVPAAEKQCERNVQGMRFVDIELVERVVTEQNNQRNSEYQFFVEFNKGCEDNHRRTYCPDYLEEDQIKIPV